MFLAHRSRLAPAFRPFYAFPRKGSSRNDAHTYEALKGDRNVGPELLLGKFLSTYIHLFLAKAVFF